MGFLFWLYNTKFGLWLNAAGSFFVSKFLIYTVMSKWFRFEQLYIPYVFDFYDLRFFIFCIFFWMIWYSLNTMLVPYFMDFYFEKDALHLGGMPILGGNSIPSAAYHDVTD